MVSRSPLPPRRRVVLDAAVLGAASRLVAGLGLGRMPALTLACRWCGRAPPDDDELAAAPALIGPRSLAWIGGPLDRPTKRPSARATDEASDETNATERTGT